MWLAVSHAQVYHCVISIKLLNKLIPLTSGLQKPLDENNSSLVRIIALVILQCKVTTNLGPYFFAVYYLQFHDSCISTFWLIIMAGWWVTIAFGLSFPWLCVLCFMPNQVCVTIIVRTCRAIAHYWSRKLLQFSLVSQYREWLHLCSKDLMSIWKS